MSLPLVPKVSGTIPLPSPECANTNISKFNDRMNQLVSTVAKITLLKNTFVNDISTMTLSPEQCKGLSLSQFLQVKTMTMGLNVLIKKIIPGKDVEIYNLFKKLSESMVVDKSKFKFRNTMIDAIKRELINCPEGSKEVLEELTVLKELSENKNFFESKLDSSVPLSKAAGKNLKNIQKFFETFMARIVEPEQKVKERSSEEDSFLINETGQVLENPYTSNECEVKEKEAKSESEGTSDSEEGCEDEDELNERFINVCSPSSNAKKMEAKKELYKLTIITSPHLISRGSPDSTIERIAQLQQIHALNAFKDTLNMMVLARSYLKEQNEKLNSVLKFTFPNVFFPYFFLLGHSALEQGLNVLQIKKHKYTSDAPLGVNRHRLHRILDNLNMTRKIDSNNFWLAQNDIGTFNWRYPNSQVLSCNRVRQRIPDALTNIIGLESLSTTGKVIELYQKISTQWLGSWLDFHAEIQTTQQAYDNMQEIETIKESFMVNKEGSDLSLALLELPLKLKESFDQTYNDLNSLKEFFKNTLIPNALTRYRNGSEVACLKDLNHHIMQLRDLCSTMRHISHFPYLYCYLHLAMLSGQFAAENIGKALADQKGKKELGSSVRGLHDLSKFSKLNLWKDLSARENELLNSLNLKKHSEYPYRYFANLSSSDNKSTLMFRKGYLYSVRNKFIGNIEEYSKTGELVIEICNLIQRLTIKLDAKKECEFVKLKKKESKSAA